MIGRTLRVAGDALLTVPVLAAAAPLWFLPWRAAVVTGRAAGACAFALWPKARRAGMINLHRAYGIDRRTARSMTLDVFRNMGQSIAEGIQFSRRSGSVDADAIRRLEDPELAARILADPRPKIFVTGHFGSWEIAIMLAASDMGGKGAVIARAVDNPFLDAIVRRLRVSSPEQFIEKRGAMAKAVETLREGRSLAMLVDENAGRRGPFVDFFGRPASAWKTPAVLSLMTGAPIVVGAAVRRGPSPPFFYRLAMIDRAGERDDIGKSVRAITAEIAGTLERWIREDPLQWRWIHWRWRARPDSTDETYTSKDVARCFDRSSVAASSEGRTA